MGLCFLRVVGVLGAILILGREREREGERESRGTRVKQRDRKTENQSNNKVFVCV